MQLILYLIFLLMPWQRPEVLLGLERDVGLEYVDLVILLFMYLLVVGILVRQIPPTAFLFAPISLVLLSGCLSALVAGVVPYHIVALLKELYLFGWFWALSIYLQKPGVFHSAIRFWLAVTWLEGLLMLIAPLVLLDYDYFFDWVGRGFLDSRVHGLFPDSNMAANYLLLGSLLGLAFPPVSHRLGQLVFHSVLAGGVLATGSNGGLGALMVGWAVFLFFYMHAKFSSHIVRAIWVSTCLFLTFFAASIALIGLDRIVVFIVHQSPGTHLGRVERSLEGREEKIGVAMAMYAREPLFGIGPGGTSESGKPAYPHNDFLAKLVENGPLGLLAYLGLMISLLTPTIRLRKLKGVDRAVPAALMGGYVANTLQSLTIQTFHFRHVWVFYSVLLVVSLLAERLGLVVRSGAHSAVPAPPVT